MKTERMGTQGSTSVPARAMINLPQRTIENPGELLRDGASARTCFRARTSNYVWAMGAVAMGLGLHFYYVREMLASLVLFCLLFFSLGLVVLSVFFVCYAGSQAAVWAGPASRAVMTLFMHHGPGGTELARVPVVEDGGRLPDQREVQT